MSAIILDTETTGFDEPQVISLAYTPILTSPRLFNAVGPIERQLFKPSKPIAYGAMATHHIIEADLAAAPPWPGSWSPPLGMEYLIGHNVDFDWKAIGSPHIARICTVALARWLWPNLDSHSLGALIYFLFPQDQARALLQHAHEADQDVFLCALVLQHFLHAQPANSWHDLWLMSERARIPTHLSFGKYGPFSDWAKANGQKKGMPIAELRRLDPGYLSWLLSGKCDTVNDDPYLQKALRGEPAIAFPTPPSNWGTVVA